MRPHRQQPTGLPRPWDSPGKNTGVGCHFLLQCVNVKSLGHVPLLVTPWTAAYQAPLSMGFSRQEYWSGVPLPSPTVYIQNPLKISQWVSEMDFFFYFLYHRCQLRLLIVIPDEWWPTFPLIRLLRYRHFPLYSFCKFLIVHLFRLPCGQRLYS